MATNRPSVEIISGPVEVTVGSHDGCWFTYYVRRDGKEHKLTAKFSRTFENNGRKVEHPSAETKSTRAGC